MESLNINNSGQRETLVPFEIGSKAHTANRRVFVSPDFSPYLDVHGLRVGDAMPKVEQFIDRALISSYSTLRILHGKGNGILKKCIRDYLQTLPFVLQCYDDHWACGGAGVTVVELR